MKTQEIMLCGTKAYYIQYTVYCTCLALGKLLALILPRHTNTFIKVIQAQLPIWAQTPRKNLPVVIKGKCMGLSTWQRYNYLCIQSHNLFWLKKKRYFFILWGFYSHIYTTILKKPHMFTVYVMDQLNVSIRTYNKALYQSYEEKSEVIVSFEIKLQYV